MCTDTEIATLRCFVFCVPQIPLWCDTCWPLDGQRGNRTISIHVFKHGNTSVWITTGNRFLLPVNEVFTTVCGVCLSACWDTHTHTHTRTHTHLGADTPVPSPRGPDTPPPEQTPLLEQTPPTPHCAVHAGRYGRYTSYWNADLLIIFILRMQRANV